MCVYPALFIITTRYRTLIRNHKSPNGECAKEGGPQSRFGIRCGRQAVQVETSCAAGIVVEATLEMWIHGGREEAGLHGVAEPMRARGREGGGAHKAASSGGEHGVVDGHRPSRVAMLGGRARCSSPPFRGGRVKRPIKARHILVTQLADPLCTALQAAPEAGAPLGPWLGRPQRVVGHFVVTGRGIGVRHRH